MQDIFFTSDTHFDHAAILTFLGLDKVTRIRPEFNDVQEMNEVMIDRWNSVVKPNSKIYHLGDVSMGKTLKHIMPRLNGEKVLILGNHDKMKTDEYLKYFSKIYSWRFFGEKQFRPKFVSCHYPLHPSSFSYKKAYNVHGHIHEKEVMIFDDERNYVPDNRYFNVSVERTNFTPLHLDQLLTILKDRAVY